jgi:hypothetical protein
MTQACSRMTPVKTQEIMTSKIMRSTEAATRGHGGWVGEENSQASADPGAQPACGPGWAPSGELAVLELKGRDRGYESFVLNTLNKRYNPFSLAFNQHFIRYRWTRKTNICIRAIYRQRTAGNVLPRQPRPHLAPRIVILPLRPATSTCLYFVFEHIDLDTYSVHWKTWISPGTSITGFPTRAKGTLLSFGLAPDQSVSPERIGLYHNSSSKAACCCYGVLRLLGF